MSMNTIEISELGCYLDNHRGHYLTRDMIELAVGFGYIIGPFERFALDAYDDHYSDDNYPFEGLVELAADALSWLNWDSREIRPHGQNFPPIIPEDCAWDWFDGDFGLYAIDDLD